MTVRTSVVIPSFNAAAYLDEALASVARQTSPADEVIVVDDCSTDASIEIAQSHDVVLLSTPTNSGHAAARNVGIAAATGDVIAWLDADDYWEPDHIETVVGLLERWPEADVAYSGVRLVGSRSDVWDDFCCVDRPKRLFWECLDFTIVPAQSVATRTDALRRVGGFDQSIRVAPDYDLWLRMSRYSKFVSSNRVTANYRWHANQISSDRSKQIASINKSRERFLDQTRKGRFSSGDAEWWTQLSQEWCEGVMSAWYRRDLEALRRQLRYGRWLAPSRGFHWRMKALSMIPSRWLSAWDRLQSAPAVY